MNECLDFTETYMYTLLYKLRHVVLRFNGIYPICKVLYTLHLYKLEKNQVVVALGVVRDAMYLSVLLMKGTATACQLPCCSLSRYIDDSRYLA